MGFRSPPPLDLYTCPEGGYQRGVGSLIPPLVSSRSRLTPVAYLREPWLPLEGLDPLDLGGLQDRRIAVLLQVDCSCWSLFFCMLSLSLFVCVVYLLIVVVSFVCCWCLSLFCMLYICIYSCMFLLLYLIFVVCLLSILCCCCIYSCLCCSLCMFLIVVVV